MSLERIAEILCVDEVKLMHGPKGVAAYVRIDKSWHSSTIDNEILEGRRLESIAEHLAHLADANMGKIRDVLRKGHAAVSGGATRAALEADRAAQRSRSYSAPTWDDVPFGDPYDGVVWQVRRSADPVVPALPATYEPAVPASSDPMPSRFHAIMAELRDL